MTKDQRLKTEDWEQKTKDHPPKADEKCCSLRASVFGLEWGFTISELVVVFMIAFIVGLLLLPFVQYGRKNMKKIICVNNLQEIGLALYIYAREHEGKFPPNIKSLYREQYLADRRLMDCPATKGTGDPDAPEYLYTAGLSVKDSSLDILVRDKAKNHSQGGKNILHVNGTIAWEE